MSGAVGVVRELVAYHGLRGILARVASRVWNDVRLHGWSSERHAWYALELGDRRAAVPLPAGVRVTEGREDDVDRLTEIPSTGRLMARGWLRRGFRLYFAWAGDRPVLSTWVFDREVSVSVAPGGWLKLPPRTVALDETYVRADLRGQGIAPGVWSEVADRLAVEGVERMLATVETSNSAARRAFAKAGFREFATMHTRHRLGRASMRVDARDELGRELQALWSGPRA